RPFTRIPRSGHPELARNTIRTDSGPTSPDSPGHGRRPCRRCPVGPRHPGATAPGRGHGGSAMSSGAHRIELAGALNVRDLGGLATAADVVTRFGRLIRSGGLQDLTPADVEHLTRTLGVREVIDLRSGTEVRREGPGPLARVPGITIHNLSLLADAPPDVDRVDTDRAMPWHRTTADGRPKPAGSTGHYLRYCSERPDS